MWSITCLSLFSVLTRFRSLSSVLTRCLSLSSCLQHSHARHVLALFRSRFRSGLNRNRTVLARQEVVLRARLCYRGSMQFSYRLHSKTITMPNRTKSCQRGSFMPCKRGISHISVDKRIFNMLRFLPHSSPSPSSPVSGAMMSTAYHHTIQQGFSVCTRSQPPIPDCTHSQLTLLVPRQASQVRTHARAVIIMTPWGLLRLAPTLTKKGLTNPLPTIRNS